MRRYAILDPETNEVLTVVEHDDEAEQAVLDQIAAAEAHNAQVAAIRAAMPDDVLPPASDYVEVPTFVAWDKPETAVEVDEAVATGDIHNPTAGTWSRPAPPTPAPTPLTMSLALLVPLYRAAIITDTEAAAALGDPPDSKYVIDGDRLVRQDI